MLIHWPTDYEALGNSFGFATHNEQARRALVEAGATVDANASIAVHVAPAHLFCPVPGKRNVLYTAWEMEEIPPGQVAKMRQADAVVVTASFLVSAVARHLPATPVYYCPLGVDGDVFHAVRRRRPVGRPFRFLWVGAPNARKGWELALQAFRPFMGDRRFELYIKTTVTGRIERASQVIFDSRRLSTPDLAALYHSAHCLVFPSFGEGFGLTMAEAMATGLPVIYTPWSAALDLAPLLARCGFPVGYRMIDVQAQDSGGIVPAGAATTEPAIPARIAQADVGDLAATMAGVWRDYPRALKIGRRASARIQSEFTWHRTGTTLVDIVRRVSAGPSSSSPRESGVPRRSAGSSS
jgi:glycosyltransferase involved in cell wall biosynthesis